MAALAASVYALLPPRFSATMVRALA